MRHAEYVLPGEDVKSEAKIHVHRDNPRAPGPESLAPNPESNSLCYDGLFRESPTHGRVGQRRR